MHLILLLVVPRVQKVSSTSHRVTLKPLRILDDCSRLYLTGMTALAEGHLIRGSDGYYILNNNALGG